MDTTWNPAYKSTDVTLSNGDKTASYMNEAYDSVLGTSGKSTGKHYLEMVINSTALVVGVGNASTRLNGRSWNTANIRGAYSNRKVPTDVVYGAALAADDVVGIAVDLVNNTIGFYKNNTYLGVAYSDLGSMGTIYPYASCASYSTYTVTLRTLQSEFSYTPPAGFTPWDGLAVNQIPQAIS